MVFAHGFGKRIPANVPTGCQQRISRQRTTTATMMRLVVAVGGSYQRDMSWEENGGSVWVEDYSYWGCKIEIDFA